MRISSIISPCKHPKRHVVAPASKLMGWPTQPARPHNNSINAIRCWFFEMNLGPHQSCVLWLMSNSEQYMWTSKSILLLFSIFCAPFIMSWSIQGLSQKKLSTLFLLGQNCCLLKRRRPKIGKILDLVLNKEGDQGVLNFMWNFGGLQNLTLLARSDKKSPKFTYGGVTGLGLSPNFF